MVWERLGSTSVGAGAVTNTAWKELTRSAAISTETHTITTPTFAAKDNLKIIIYGAGADNSGVRPRIQFNSDTGTNYAYRGYNNGSSDTATNANFIYISESDVDQAMISVLDITNTASKEKMVTGHTTRTSNSSSGTAPQRWETAGKWANTSDQITSISLVAYSTTAQGFSAGWEIVVLGCDNDEADTGSNFWQELGTTTKTSNGNEIEVASLAAKKYLLIEYHTTPNGNTDDIKLLFNSDNSGNDYAIRRSGLVTGSDTSTSQNFAKISANNGAWNRDGYVYLINVSGNVKLGISVAILNEGGNGSGNVPIIWITDIKYVTTSGQITSIQMQDQGSGNFASGSRITVYGAD